MPVTTPSGLILPSSLTREVGHASGGSSVIFGGVADDASEPNLAWLWPESIKICDEMRRDPKIQEVFNAVTMPIRSTTWALHPNGAPAEVVEQISEDMDLPILGQEQKQDRRRQRNRFAWDEHLRLALLELYYGHMVFEIVVDAEQLEKTGKARLRKLAPRMPQTIAHIETARDGGLEWIRQHPAGLLPGLTADLLKEPKIPVDSLVWYAHAKEGGAWQGQSAFRAAYVPWKIKQDSIRVHAVTIRRNGMGVPQYVAPPGATQTQIEEGAKYAQTWRSGETSGGAAPHGGMVTLEGVRGSLPDTVGFLRYLDEQIAGVALAEFLKLGSSTSGSRSLGGTFLDFFTSNLEAVARHVAAVTTAHVIEKFVDWNYGPEVQAPRVVFEKIDSEQKVTAEAVKALIDSGALVPDRELENWLRDTYRMPDKMEGSPDPKPLDDAPPAPGGDNVLQPPRPDGRLKPVQARRAARARHIQAAAGDRSSASDEETAAGFDPDAVDDDWSEMLDETLTAWSSVRAAQIAAVVAALTVALRAGDLDAVANLSAGAGLGTAVLTDKLGKMAERAARTAQSEALRQGVTLPLPDLSGVAAKSAARAAATDTILARGLSGAAARQGIRRLDQDISEVAAAVKTHLEELSDAYLVEQLGGALTAAQNDARVETLDQGPVRAWYASEILDRNTCEACAEVDGTDFATREEVDEYYGNGGYAECLGGDRCRGTVVAVFESEAEPTMQE